MKIVRIVGGLGSQMMANALSIAIRARGIHARSEFSYFLYHKLHNGAELSRVFGVDEWYSPLWGPLLNRQTLRTRVVRKLLRSSGIVRFHRAEEAHYNYDESVFRAERLSIIEQAWTAWRYFEGVESDIVAAYRFPPHVDPRNLAVAEQALSSESVAVHIRRGDYLENKILGGLTPASYYQAALEVVKAHVSSPRYFVFSDDPSWCQSNLSLAGAQFIDWNTGSASFRDMQLMAQCRHHVIPNSSFSWWGAWLANRHGLVVAPKRWANPESGIELADMNMPHWQLVQNYD